MALEQKIFGPVKHIMLKVLIVEDGAIFRQLMHETLRSRFSSIEIYEAEGEDEALQKVETLVPDLVFIDIRLRQGNGLELTRKIKTDHPEVTAVILTNYDLPEYREAALQYKADHFIPKDSFIKMVNLILSDWPGDLR